MVRDYRCVGGRAGGVQVIRVFIGYDPRQPASYATFAHSLMVHSKQPIAITPLILETLPLKRVGLTPFTFSRFLVPYLCDYQGWALFADIDMMARADISELFELRDDRYAVMVSKNKLRFEWTSLMLFNCDKCRVLTPEYIGTAGGLHKVDWTDHIGELPGEWNHLVGYDEPNPEAKLAHFTQGVPAFPETADSEFGDEWRKMASQAFSAQPWASLMGNSVHAQPVYERLRTKRLA